MVASKGCESFRAYKDKPKNTLSFDGEGRRESENFLFSEGFICIPSIPSPQGNRRVDFYEAIKDDGFVKTRKGPIFVIPATAGHEVKL
jgi:hypothetical protein